MLKIHSFLQRAKKPLEKVIPEQFGKSKLTLAVVAYAMVTILFLLSSDYMNGNGLKESNSLAKAETTQAANNISEETAMEANVQIDSSKLDNQFLRNEIIASSTQGVNLTSLQMNLITKAINKLNQEISANNDSKNDTEKYEGSLKTIASGKIGKDNNLEDANIDQANVSAQVDSGSTKEIEESTSSVSSTDAKKKDTIESSKDKNAKEDKLESTKISSKKSETKSNQSKSKKTDTKTKKEADKKGNVVDLSDKEIEILQRIVEAEASGENIKGKMLVANVILNRVKSKQFPDTIEGVVFQKNQFSPIRDGRYYSVKVSQSTKKAVNRVLKGEDESRGALYFSARSKADKNSMTWFDSHLTFLFKYGGHEFFK